MKFRILILSIVLAVLMSSQAPGAVRPAHGPHVASYTGMSWFLVAFELGPWDEYLLNEITPDLERLTKDYSPRVSWLHVEDRFIIPDFAFSLLDQPRSSLSPLVVSLQNHRVSLDVFGSNGDHDSGNGMLFEQAMLMPGLTHRMSERNAVTVSAILASQRYGTAGLNLQETDSLARRVGSHHDYPMNAGYPGRNVDVSHGTGVRLALSGELLPSLKYEAAFQSRIEMAELATLQGFHGAQAELDIPSRIQLGMQLQATDRSALKVGVSQIFYSEVRAFPSRTLPARFNALLGDSSSPQFAWNDLLVYSVGWQWWPGSDLAFHVDYYSRTQPKPDSPVLASALAPELAQNAFMAGFTKGLGERHRFRFNAAYAPPEFAFGGNVMGVVTDQLGQSIEVKASLSFDF